VPGAESQHALLLLLTGLAVLVRYVVSLRATDHMPACDVCAWACSWAAGCCGALIIVPKSTLDALPNGPDLT
jgi:hypothetical protein